MTLTTQPSAGIGSGLAGRVAATLGIEPPAGPGALALLTEACIERLAGRDSDHGDVEPEVLTALVCELQAESLRLTQMRVADRARRIAACESGLGRLRTVTSTRVLIDRVCAELASSCGLERVLLSRVENGLWRPWVVNAAVDVEEWFREWVERPTPLSGMYLESALMEQHRPALVTDTAGRRMHPIIRAGGSNSFVVAPISTVPPASEADAVGRVVGFFHADHGTGGDRCDETDRDLLWAFTEGFAHLYERTALLDRLRDQRGRVRETLAVVDRALEELTEAEIELVIAADDDSLSHTATSVGAGGGGLAHLTRREQDILAVVAEGATNKEIADRLVLSVGTVKTHVKHILAKLGAVNRSQAIAAYLSAPDSG